MENLTGTTSPTPEAAELRALFLAVMRKLAATITLVTTCEEGQPHGMAATAVCSLTADPPSVLACVKRTASMHGPVTRVKWLCINLLGQQHAELFREFTRRQGSDRFQVGQWSHGPHHLPRLDDSVGSLVCFVEKQVEFGTHTIFVGLVVSAEATLGKIPLLYQEASVGQFVASASQPPGASLKLGNVIYPVTQMERAIAFYRDTLGLRLKFRDGDGWAAFDAGGTTLALQRVTEAERALPIKVSLKVSGDLDEFANRMSAAGAPLSAVCTGVHEKTALVTDPDGNPITLYAPLQEPRS